MFEAVVPILAFGTLLAIVIFALVSRHRTLQRKHDPNAPISTLARDGKYGGVGFLVPPDQRRRPEFRKDSARDNLEYERSEA